MNRREMFKRLGIAAAAVTTVAAVKPDAHVAADVEPVPTKWDFERPFWCEQDLSIHGISEALSRLGWESGLEPKPLLCVHPQDYARALEDASFFGGLVQVWATREVGRVYASPDSDVNPLLAGRDSWLVAWRGRRIGSVGA